MNNRIKYSKRINNKEEKLLYINNEILRLKKQMYSSSNIENLCINLLKGLIELNHKYPSYFYKVTCRYNFQSYEQLIEILKLAVNKEFDFKRK